MANHPQAVLTGHACRVIRVREDLPLLPERWTVQEINRRKILFSNPFPTSSIMLRRDIPFRFLNTQRYSEDYMLWLQIVFNGSPSYLLDLPLAFLFKKRYGVRGLSADMKKMEDGELFNYRRLYEMGMISFGRYCCIVQYSRIECLIRCGITRIRSGRNLH